MAYLAQESFNIPPGFAVEEIKGQLCYEDLEEDDELWLIRMPCDVELSKLDRQKIFLSDDVGGMSIKKFKTENGKSLECFAETCEISSISVVLPKKQDGQLHAVKKVLKGAILISEGLSLNNEIEIKSEKGDEYLDGDSSFITQKSNKEKTIKKKKKAHSDLNTDDLQGKHENVDELSEDSNNSTRKKKKKKKIQCDLNTNELEVKYENVNEHSEDSYNSICKKRKKSKQKHLHNDFNSDDLNYETEAAESFNSPNSKKKSSKKHSSPHRKSNEKVKIKDEPLSIDFDDGFPTCQSQEI